MANAQIPVTVPYRPFALCPETNLMNVDGFFIVNMDEQYIEAFFQNQGAEPLLDVEVYVEGFSDPGIILVPEIKHVSTMLPGASVPIRFRAFFCNAQPGVANVSFIVQGSGCAYKRVIKKIFITLIDYDKVTKTYSVAAPEGTVYTRIHKAAIGPKDVCCKGRDEPFIVLFTDVTYTWVPSANYPGTRGPLPFEDPWWKVALGILAALVGIGALLWDYFSDGELDGGVVSVGGTFDETDPSIDCCTSVQVESKGETAAVRALYGIASALATAAIASDGPDLHYRGQEATPPLPTELTTSEAVRLQIHYPVPPSLGIPYPIEGKWEYTRKTTGETYTFSAKDERKNAHYVETYTVDIPEKVDRYREPLVVKAAFKKPDGSKYKGNELYVSALLIGPQDRSRLLELHDDGRDPDQKPNDGTYTGIYYFHPLRQDWTHGVPESELDPAGKWHIYVFAQDVNAAILKMKPEEAAEHIAGFVLTNQLKLNFGGPCQLTPDGWIDVV